MCIRDSSETILKAECDQALALENVDIGGPTMIRSAAKNVGWVTVIVDPSDYENILENINEENEIDFETRSSLSSKAFGRTAQYDAIIHNYLKDLLIYSNLNFVSYLIDV